MRATTMRGRFGKERNLPGSAVECAGMRRACVTEAATSYSCARGWHSAGDPNAMGFWHMPRSMNVYPVSSFRSY